MAFIAVLVHRIEAIGSVVVAALQSLIRVSGLGIEVRDVKFIHIASRLVWIASCSGTEQIKPCGVDNHPGATKNALVIDSGFVDLRAQYSWAGHPLWVDNEVVRESLRLRMFMSRSVRIAIPHRNPIPSSPVVVSPHTSNVRRSEKYAMAPVSLTPRLNPAEGFPQPIFQELPVGDRSQRRFAPRHRSTKEENGRPSLRRSLPVRGDTAIQRLLNDAASSPTNRARHANPMSQPVAKAKGIAVDSKGSSSTCKE